MYSCSQYKETEMQPATCVHVVSVNKPHEVRVEAALPPHVESIALDIPQTRMLQMHEWTQTQAFKAACVGTSTHSEHLKVGQQGQLCQAAVYSVNGTQA